MPGAAWLICIIFLQFCPTVMSIDGSDGPETWWRQLPQSPHSAVIPTGPKTSCFTAFPLVEVKKPAGLLLPTLQALLIGGRYL